jgi:transposase
MTYSTDLRRKVLDIKEQENLTIAEAAKRFGIGTANFSRWKKSLEPKRTRNKPATKIDMEALQRDVELHPDAYHHERAQRFGVTEGGIRKALKRLGISYKKKR